MVVNGYNSFFYSTNSLIIWKNIHLDNNKGVIDGGEKEDKQVSWQELDSFE